MKKITHRIIAFFLIVVMLSVGLPTMYVVNAAISTSTFETKYKEFISDARWENGIAWGATQKPKLSTYSSQGCCAYAADFAAYVYGSTSAAWTGSSFKKFTNLNEIKAGDIIHVTNHWFVVLSRSGNNLYTCEGSVDSKTRVSTTGWKIKDGSLYYKIGSYESAIAFEYGYHYNFSDSSSSSSVATSSTKLYYNIDMSSKVLASRTNQQVSGDCAVVSMATIEAYLYGATSTADKKTVYNAVVNKNGDDNYAYWSNCGYTSYSSINWTTVYNQLATGYPVLVHRAATSNQAQHWAVVAGYKGSTTKLETDKFVIVDVYHGTGGKDIYTSAEWASGTSIDRMVTRFNGISLTSLSGIRFAIDHPGIVHKYGEGHGVLGYVASNTNLTSVRVMVTDVNTGKNVYYKVVEPNAKSYLIFNLDSEMTFAKWEEGEYFYTIVATTDSGSRAYQKYFTINSAWPITEPKRNYTINYNLNGGSGSIPAQTVAYGNAVVITSTVPTKEGYTFAGWSLKRTTDEAWYTTTGTWSSESNITSSGLTKRVFASGVSNNISYEWVKNCFTNKNYTYYAVWEKNAATLSSIAVESLPAKTTYQVGDVLDTTGMKIKLTYSDNTTESVTAGFTTSGFSSETTGVKTVTVSYGGKTANFNVTVEDDATTDAKYKITNVSGSAGSTVEVFVSIANNPGIISLRNTITYDDSALELISVQDCGLLEGYTTPSATIESPYTLRWADSLATVNNTANGQLVKLIFKIKSDVKAGSYNISVAPVEARNVEGTKVAFTGASATVNVIEGIIGDTDGDGEISDWDAIILNRYLAGWNVGVELASADIDRDGEVSDWDAIVLERYLAGWNIKLES
ncbi:MAG: hypothetical protein E7387_07150 [Ruminococcaceae bacterium]|nr:hypothetical protein [Oscillospiraceae bacterium]